MAYEVNGRDVGFFGYWWRMLLGLWVLALRCIIQPWRVLGLKKFIVSGWKDGQRIWLSHPAHRDRVTYDVVDTTPSLAREAAVQEMIVELVEDCDWMSLGELLVELDQNRASSPRNQRLIHPALEAIIETLAGGVRSPYDCAARENTAIPDAPVQELSALAAANPDVYALGAVAAEILLHQCWDLRGQDYVDAIPDSHFARMDQKATQALALLEKVGVETRNSPLLTQTRLKLLPFVEDAQRALPVWFEQAQRSDPGDSRAAYVIGNLLLPRWFGDYEAIEVKARQAAAMSSKEMGVAAYAVLYNAALEMEPEPLYFVDIDMYCEGIEDLVRYRGYGADHLPYLSEFLHDLSQTEPPRGLSDEDREMWNAKTHRLYLLGLSLIEDHLSCIHPGSWRMGEDGALDMISLAMGRELEAGANLVVGPKGIKAQFPEEPSVS